MVFFNKNRTLTEERKNWVELVKLTTRIEQASSPPMAMSPGHMNLFGHEESLIFQWAAVWITFAITAKCDTATALIKSLGALLASPNQ
jgi:hypothetical protein